MSLRSRLHSLFTHKPPVSAEVAEPAVDELIELGFLKFVTASEVPELRKRLVESVQRRYLDTGWDEDDGVSADQRSYFADGEELAEGNVGVCIREMASVLEREAVELNTVEDDFGEERYRVVINGKPHLIYDRTGDPEQDGWTTAHKRLLEIVNSLLKDAGSQERAYALYCGGNEGLVMLLTPEMHEYIRGRNELFDQQWMPRSADEIGAGH